MSNSARVNLTEPLSYWEKVYLHFRIRAVKLTRNIKHRIGLTERAPIFHFIRDRYLDRSEAAYDDFSLGDWKLEDYGEIPRIFYLTQYSSARGRPDGSLCDRVKVGMWRLERGRVFRLKPPFPNHTALRKLHLGKNHDSRADPCFLPYAMVDFAFTKTGPSKGVLEEKVFFSNLNGATWLVDMEVVKPHELRVLASRCVQRS